MNKELVAVQLERAMEQLRQEREVFEQRKRHQTLWFHLRLVMGYSSVMLLVGVMALASYILLNNDKFPSTVVISAGAALFVDVLGMLIGIWKIALNPGFMGQITPMTQITLPDIEMPSSSKPVFVPISDEEK